MAPLYSFLFALSVSLSVLPSTLSLSHSAHTRNDDHPDHRRHWKRPFNKNAATCNHTWPQKNPNECNTQPANATVISTVIVQTTTTTFVAQSTDVEEAVTSTSATEQPSTAPSISSTSTPQVASFSTTTSQTISASTTSSATSASTTATSTTSTNTDTASSNGSGASDEDVQEYLDYHNTVRAQHGASALTWNNTLAAAAQVWANKCVFEHSGGTLGPYGENLAAGTGNYTIDNAITSWTNEVSSTTENVYNHFTQVVWKATSQVGCAVQSCSGIFDASYGPAQYYVCEYYTQGNVIGEWDANVQL
jgi:uncharacterized protein YkwD